MLTAINELKTALTPLFSEVSIMDERPLAKSNVITIYLTKVEREYLTSQRVRYKGTVPLIFTINTTSDNLISDVDNKLNEVLTAIDGLDVFEWELVDVEFHFIANMNRLYAFVNLRMFWEDTIW